MRVFLTSALLLVAAALGISAHAVTYHDSFGPRQGYDQYYGEVLGNNRQDPWNHQVGFQFIAQATGPVELFELAIETNHGFLDDDEVPPESNTFRVTLHTDRRGLVGQEIDSAKMSVRRSSPPVVRAASDYRTTLYKGEKYWFVVRANYETIWNYSTVGIQAGRDLRRADTWSGANFIKLVPVKALPAAFRVLGPGAPESFRRLD